MKEPETPRVSEATETPLAYRAVRGGVWVTVSSYWQIGFGFIANIFLTRILFPEAFGTMALAVFFAQLLRLQPRLGLSQAFAQHGETNGTNLGTYLALEGIAAFLSLALGIIAVPILIWLRYGETVAWLSVALLIGGVFESFAGVGSTILDKELRFAQTSIVQAITFPISYLPAFLLALRGAGPWSLVAQNVTFSLLSLLGTWWFVVRQPEFPDPSKWAFDRDLARRLLRFGVSVGVVTLIGMLLTQLDNFYIGTFVNTRQLGFYDRAYRLAQWPVLLVNALLTRTAFYTYARLQHEPLRLQRAVEMVVWIIIGISVPILVALIIAAPDLLTLLYTNRWLPSAKFLRILAMFALLRPLMINADTFFIAVGNPGLPVRYSFLQLIVLATLGYPLTLRWGATGAIWAVGLMLISGVVISYYRMKSQIDVHLVRLLASPGLASVLLVAGYWAAIRELELTNLSLVVRVSVKSIYAIVGYILLISIFEPHSTKERVKYIRHLMFS